MHEFKDVLSVLLPFLLGLFTNYLTDRRVNRKDDRDYNLSENTYLSHKITEYSKKIDDLNEQVIRYKTKANEWETKYNDLKKKMDEKLRKDLQK